jgi:hypothetical protein
MAMTRGALLAHIARAFGPERTFEELGQDLANAAARRYAEPRPAPVPSYSESPLEPTLFLFEVFAWSLPWLEPAQVQRHLGALLRLSVVHEPTDDGYAPRAFDALRFLLAPEALPSLRAAQRVLLAPLTAAQRAVIAACVRGAGGTDETVAAWARVVAHDRSGAPEPWFDVFSPEPPVPDLPSLCALWQRAFPEGATEPLPDLSSRAETPFYLPFVSAERRDALLSRFATAVLREPDHPDTPALIRQLHALFQPFQEPDGAPLVREQLAGLSREQRRAVYGLARYAFPDDDLLALWAQVASLEGPDWSRRLVRPDGDPDFRRASWLESVRAVVGCTGRRPLPRAQRDLAPVAQTIEAAFDGVPAPGPGARTLFEAEEADSWGTTDVARGRASHRGRWQDLPTDELRDGYSAWSYLSASGLRYYAPAVMLRHLEWSEQRADEWRPALYLGLFEGIAFAFSPSGVEDDDQRAYMEERLAPLTAPQRRAVLRFLEATGRPDEVAPWARVVAHDEAGAPGAWFDVLWPPRRRPDPVAVHAGLVAAFPDVVPPPALDPDHGLRARVPPAAFAARLAEEALFVLTTADVAARHDSIRRITWSLAPSWGARDHAHQRARLLTLDLPQRRAVSAFCDLVVARSALREMWRRAAADERDDWFDSLKLP